MNLIFINQYYPPDGAPTGLMLEEVGRQLVASGHDVTILCSAGGYSATASATVCSNSGKTGEPGLPGVRVVRCWSTRFGRSSFTGKLVDYASFYAGVAWELLTDARRPDRVIALTTPPYLSVLARLAGKFRGADHAHWVMDLYPDVMAAHGMLREGGTAYRLLAWLARFGFGGNRCAAVITLGPDMAERVSQLLTDGRKADWVALWETETASPNSIGDASNERRLESEALRLREERGWSCGETVFMYSGNMGLGHRFGEFLAASTRARELPAMRLAFFGAGKRRPEIEHHALSHPEARLEMHDYVPRTQLAAHLRSADVHLASLEPSWDGTMVPSKLQGIFAAGRPVIFVGSINSAIGRWIVESGGGWVVPPDDPGALDQALVAACERPERERRAAAARIFATTHFNRQQNARKTAHLLSRGLVGSS